MPRRETLSLPSKAVNKPTLSAPWGDPLYFSRMFAIQMSMRIQSGTKWVLTRHTWMWELSPNNRSDINIYSWIKRCEEIISQVKSFISGTLSYCFFGNFLFPGLFVFPFWNSSVNNKIFRIYPLIVFYFLPFPPFLFVLLYDWLLPLFSFHSVITFLTSAVIFVNFQNIFLSFWMVLTFYLFVGLFVSWVWAYQLKWLFVFCLLLLPTSPCLL